jgi:hypothetical protein
MSFIYDYTAAEEEQHLIITVTGRRVNLRWRGHGLDLRKSRSTQYLIELLLHPYQGISATALYALVNNSLPRCSSIEQTGLAPEMEGSTFHPLLPAPLSDPQAIREVKLRLNILTVQIAEAESWNDLGCLEELKLERDTLVDYLRDSLSRYQGDQARQDADYKCSDNVYHALQNVLNTISSACPELGILLRDSLHVWSDLLFIPARGLSVLVMENPEASEEQK